jgi:hypothetical protein
MNCQDFESNLDGLARGALMDARAREVALAHERTCGVCAARLADERALTSGLRALADTTKDACAPARVEAVLLAAFRAQVVANAASALPEKASVGQFSKESANVTQLTTENVRQLSWVKTVAVAALAAAAAITLFMLIPPGMSVPAPKSNEAAAVNQTAGREKGVAPSGVDNNTKPNGTGKEEVASTSSEGGGQSLKDSNGDDESVVSLGEVVRHSPRVIRGTPASLNTGRGISQAASASVAATVENEITTDFIPLMQGARLSEDDGVRMVRVELPRSALARFGLPVNAEASGGRIKADVLLGEDGLARAIRFVR